jgi:hypothetical protein
MFQDWVKTCAIPEIKAYCSKQNLYFKALILVDNAPGHPVYVDELCENVKFAFLPPNTTSVIQPMDQCVISNFKSYYFLRTFKLLIEKTDGADKLNMLQFWKQFDIKKAITIIRDSWDEVKPTSMNGSWRKLWPECVHKKSQKETEVAQVVHEIVTLAKDYNFEGMEENDVKELLVATPHELTNEELLDLSLNNEEEESCSTLQVTEKPEITLKQISKALKLIEEGLDIFLQNDPNSMRSLKVSQLIASNLICYKDIYQKLGGKAVQQTLDHYFFKKEPKTNIYDQENDE